MTATGAAMSKSEKPKQPKRVHVAPSAETNRIVLKECSKVTVDVKKVMERFNVSHKDAIVLAAAAEQNLLPPVK